MSEKLHKFVYQLTSVLIYIYALALIYSYDSSSAYTIGGLVLIRFIASQLFFLEMRKKDEEVIKEMEHLLDAKERQFFEELEKKYKDVEK